MFGLSSLIVLERVSNTLAVADTVELASDRMKKVEKKIELVAIIQLK